MFLIISFHFLGHFTIACPKEEYGLNSRSFFLSLMQASDKGVCKPSLYTKCNGGNCWRSAGVNFYAIMQHLFINMTKISMVILIESDLIFV